MVPWCRAPLTVKGMYPRPLLKDHHVCESLSTVPGPQISAHKTVAVAIMMLFIYRIKMLSCLFAPPFWTFPLNTQFIKCYLPLENPCCIAPIGHAPLEESDPLNRLHRAYGLLPSWLWKGLVMAAHQLSGSQPTGSERVCVSPLSSRFHPRASFALQGSIRYQQAHASLLEHCVSTVFWPRTFDLSTAKVTFPQSHVTHMRSKAEAKRNKGSKKPLFL